MIWAMVVTCLVLSVINTFISGLALTGLWLLQKEQSKQRAEVTNQYIALVKACESTISSMQSAFLTNALASIPSSRLPQA